MVIDPWLARAAAIAPERIALVTPERSLSYRELAAQAAAAAARLRSSGVRAGERVAVGAPSDADFVVALHAILWLGAVAVPIDPRLAPGEQALRAASAKHAIELPLQGGAGVPAEPVVPNPDSAALLLHTSGTTGAATPVELTHANLLFSALGSAVALGLDPAERWLCTLPLAHVGGLSILLRSALYATTAVLHPSFDADRVASELATGATTLVSLVPTTLARLLDAGASAPPRLRRALIGGGPLAAPLLARALDAGLPVVQTYGLTEACSQVTTARTPEDTSAGPPLPLVSVALGGPPPDAGAAWQPGVGEILVDGPTVAAGARATDGLLHTGDLGRLDDAGHLHVIGRRADTIVSGGENVAPSEVEAVLMSHPHVAEAAVHGREHSEWGEVVIARVVPVAGVELNSELLREHCAQQLAPFKVPKAIERAESLPRTPSGKLRRGELR
jgi:O-succinylbenzoic acid--CoA ligase